MTKAAMRPKVARPETVQDVQGVQGWLFRVIPAGAERPESAVCPAV